MTRSRYANLLWVSLLWVLCCAGPALAQQPPDPDEDEEQEDDDKERAGVPSGAEAPVVPPPARPLQASKKEGLQPFGAKLFMGNFLRAREDGLNPDYQVMPGDRVAVHTWGAVNINQVLVVDGQGNVFLPDIGPISLAGVPNHELTRVMEQAIGRVYRRNVKVYTNLITAKPVAVYVTGGVRQPGHYAGVPSDSVLFFLDQAGGIDAEAGSYRRIEILREGQQIADIDLYDFMLRGKLASPQFQDGDTVLVHQRGPVVELRGNVATPALLEFKEEPITGKEALSVVPAAARATEVTISGLRRGVPLNQTLSVRGFEAQRLRDGDVITLRDDGRAETILVNLEGEFEGPSLLAVQRGARLIDVLNHVRADRQLSNVSAVYLRRPSVAQAQKDAINDSVFRLERSALLALSQTTGEAEIRVKEAELMQSFAERARAIDPLGRVVTSYEGQQINMRLEDGDTIVIPPKTNVVRIGGEVQIAQAVLHRPGMTAEEYVARAGGYSDRADDDRIILIHPNAAVEIVDPDTEIAAGDEILVPPEVDPKILQNAADVTQVIYQIAVAAAVVLAL